LQSSTIELDYILQLSTSTELGCILQSSTIELDCISQVSTSAELGCILQSSTIELDCILHSSTAEFEGSLQSSLYVDYPYLAILCKGVILLVISYCITLPVCFHSLIRLLNACAHIGFVLYLLIHFCTLKSNENFTATLTGAILNVLSF
jgi:hypothetical protein